MVFLARTLLAASATLLAVLSISLATGVGPGLGPVTVSGAAHERGRLGADGRAPSPFLSGGNDPATAAHWSTCQPIRWTIDRTNIEASGVARQGEVGRWQRVVASFSDVTGYRLKYVATKPGRAAHEPGVLPTIDGVDIVITYESADDPGGYQRPSLADSRRVAESWLSWLEDGTGRKRATTGSVVMDYEDLAAATGTGGYDPEDRFALMAHEFGHAMGLGHDEDESTVMFDEWLAGKGGLTDADKATLRALAAQSCD